MLNLYRSNTTSVENAYIITVNGNVNSEKYSARAQQSCKDVGMPFKVWDAYNGTNQNNQIVAPAHLKNDSVMNMLKITDHYMTRGEVACALSHISLWVHCAVIDKPIVILEHDAIMSKRFEVVENYNTIVYLGGNEWKNLGWKIYPIPPHASEGPNYLFICRAHAYAIDPAMAKNLISYVIKNGIVAPLDIMLRADLFNISHQGMFAYDNSSDKLDTTIKARPTEGRSTKRNDKLEW
jgi:GR25 family glycosyltransferase involved in LPS biosynthesis